MASDHSGKAVFVLAQNGGVYLLDPSANTLRQIIKPSDYLDPTRGDLYAAVNIITPTSLSREQRKLLEDLAKLELEDPSQERGIIDKVKDIFG